MSKKQKLMAEIILLAVKVQEETERAVFIRFSGHVDTMEIEIASSKASYNRKIATSEFNTSPNSLSSEEYTIERMEDVKRTLLEIIEDKKVDVSKMGYEIEEVKHYVF